MPCVSVIESWDLAVFRWINRDWAGPAVDPWMHFLSGNRYFIPALAALGVGLLWRGGRRGRVFVVTLALVAAFANGLVADPMKRIIRRPRPYAVVSDVVLRVGKGNPLGSMPSAHAMNCALMAAVAGWYYRRSLWLAAPVAFGVAWSRVYNGAHFPSDVLAGAGLGAGSAGLGLYVSERAWRWLGPRFAPAWVLVMPSWTRPEWDAAKPASTAAHGPSDGARG